MIKGISPVAVKEKTWNLYFSILLPLYLDQTSDHLASNLPLWLLMIALYTCLVAHTLIITIPILSIQNLCYFSSAQWILMQTIFLLHACLPQCLCQIHPRNAHRWRIADYSNPSWRVGLHGCVAVDGGTCCFVKNPLRSRVMWPLCGLQDV